MNAPLEVKVAALSKTRDISQRFKPTTTSTETFVLTTHLDNYESEIEPLLTRVWNYVLTLRTNIYTEVGLHYTLTVDNVTAPAPPTGALVQPKEHFDGALADGDFDSVDALRQRLAIAVQTVRTLAKY